MEKQYTVGVTLCHQDESQMFFSREMSKSEAEEFQNNVLKQIRQVCAGESPMMVLEVSETMHGGAITEFPVDLVRNTPIEVEVAEVEEPRIETFLN